MPDPVVEKIAPVVGARLVSLREARDWNRAELARRADLEPSTLRGLEEGQRLPTLRTALALAAALGLSSVEELFGAVPASGEAVAEARRSLP